MLGENIRAARQKQGMTQEELAARLHVVRQTVSKWEKNLSVPDVQCLQELAQALQVSVSTLLGAAEEPAAESTTENQIANQLARISEQMTIKNQRAHTLGKWLKGLLLAFLIGVILMLLLSMSSGLAFGSIKTSSTQSVENVSEELPAME